MQVYFTIIGRAPDTWCRAMPSLDYSGMLEEVQNHTSTLLKDYDLGYNDSENIGIIYSDNHIAGTFSIGNDRTITLTH